MGGTVYVLFLCFLYQFANIFVLFLGSGRPDVGTPEHAFSFPKAFIYMNPDYSRRVEIAAYINTEQVYLCSDEDSHAPWLHAKWAIVSRKD